MKKGCQPKNCSQSNIFSDKKECAKLYVEQNCSNCNFPEVILRVGQPFDKLINDSLTIFSSLVVRENCTVKSSATTSDGATMEPDFTYLSDGYDRIDVCLVMQNWYVLIFNNLSNVLIISLEESTQSYNVWMQLYWRVWLFAYLADRDPSRRLEYAYLQLLLFQYYE